MIVAKYSNKYVPKEYTEWLNAIKEDFRKFREYKLPNYKSATRLNNELKSFSTDISFLGYIKNEKFVIEFSKKYIFIEYPTFKYNYENALKNVTIISKNYDEFIFVKYNDDIIPVITRYYLKDNEIIEDKIIKCMDMKWNDFLEEYLDEYVVDKNLRVLKGLSSSKSELFGFPNSIYEIDCDGETEEEMKSNLDYYCCALADDYFDAMRQEDFEKIGDLKYILIEQIKSSLEKIANFSESDKEDIKKLSSGEFLTKYGRTFVSAVAKRRIMENVEHFIKHRSKEVELYAAWILWSEEYESISHSIILDYDILNRLPFSEKKEFMEFLDSLFNLLDKKINEISSDNKIFVDDEYENKKIIANERKKVIEKIKPYILNIRYLDLIDELIKKYDWLSDILDNKKNTTLKKLVNK